MRLNLFSSVKSDTIVLYKIVSRGDQFWIWYLKININKRGRIAFFFDLLFHETGFTGTTCFRLLTVAVLANIKNSKKDSWQHWFQWHCVPLFWGPWRFPSEKWMDFNEWASCGFNTWSEFLGTLKQQPSRNANWKKKIIMMLIHSRMCT